MDNLPGPDFLSYLPLGIIHDILSRVPIEDALRTSFLSRKWRYISSSLPHLTFDYRDVNPPMETESDDTRLIIFISQVLLLHEGPIHKFQLCLPSLVKNSQCINRWLIFLSRNGIRILELESDDFWSGIKVNSSLYSCQSLTNLKLYVYSIPPPPPSFKGFLFLKSLDICVFMNNRTTESILAHSPLLEVLTIDGGEFSIHALNLKYLHCDYASDLTLCTPLLQELTGCFEALTSFNIAAESSVFHHLRTIQLSSVDYNNKEVASAVIRLITGSPNLQKLEISYWVSRDDKPEVAYFGYTESALNITYNSLKVIKIEFLGGSIDEMKLIEFLLARSPVLETLVYKPFPSISDKMLLNQTTSLLRYRRASVNAQVVIHR